MSTFEKVSSFNFLELVLVKEVVVASIEVMDSGHTLIIYNELLILVLLLLLKLISLILLESLRAIWLVLIQSKILVAHLLHSFVQTLQLFWTYVLFKVWIIHVFGCFVHNTVLWFIMLARWYESTLWASFVINQISL